MKFKLGDKVFLSHSSVPYIVNKYAYYVVSEDDSSYGCYYESELSPASNEPSTILTRSQQLIAEECDKIKELLLAKNRKYGDSALHPARIFAKSDALEQIRVRIDDKLTRINNQQSDEDEDVKQDLIGYLVLERVAEKINERK